MPVERRLCSIVAAFVFLTSVCEAGKRHVGRSGDGRPVDNREHIVDAVMHLEEARSSLCKAERLILSAGQSFGEDSIAPPVLTSALDAAMRHVDRFPVRHDEIPPNFSATFCRFEQTFVSEVLSHIDLALEPNQCTPEDRGNLLLGVVSLMRHAGTKRLQDQYGIKSLHNIYAERDESYVDLPVQRFWNTSHVPIDDLDNAISVMGSQIAATRSMLERMRFDQLLLHGAYLTALNLSTPRITLSMGKLDEFRARMDRMELLTNQIAFIGDVYEASFHLLHVADAHIEDVRYLASLDSILSDEPPTQPQHQRIGLGRKQSRRSKRKQARRRRRPCDQLPEVPKRTSDIVASTMATSTTAAGQATSEAASSGTDDGPLSCPTQADHWTANAETEPRQSDGLEMASEGKPVDVMLDSSATDRFDTPGEASASCAPSERGTPVERDPSCAVALRDNVERQVEQNSIESTGVHVSGTLQQIERSSSTSGSSTDDYDDDDDTGIERLPPSTSPMEMPAESNDIPNDDNWTAAVTPTSYDSPELAARLPDEPRIKSGDPSSGELLMQYSRDTRMEDVLLGIAEFLEPPPMGDPYFDADVLGFLDWVNGACNAYDPIRDVVRRQIERIVQVEFPGSTVAPMLLPVDELYKQALFTGLDLTIVNSGLQSEGLQYLKALRERVNRLPSVSSSISLVLLPFPKLIFKLRDGPLLVTLSWNVFQPNMFATEAIIRYPLLKPVMLYVWYFLVRHGFHDVTQGGVDWQLLQVMVVSHIQMNRDVCQAPSQGRCLRAFFTYYGKRFDYNRDCISVTGNGRVFPKTDRGATALHEFRLCAESPDDPNVDVGRQAYNIAAVVDKFRQASDMLYDYYPGLLLSEDMLGAGKHALVPPA